MKKIALTIHGLLLFALTGFAWVKAEGEVPCLVFSGDSENNLSLNLSQYNRVYFKDSGMVVTSAKDISLEDIQLSYFLFNRLEFKDAIPTDVSGSIVKDMEDSHLRITYLNDYKCLLIEGDNDREFALGVFNTLGFLLKSSHVQCGKRVSIEHLSPGVYLAVATSGKNRLTIKFVIQ